MRMNFNIIYVTVFHVQKLKNFQLNIDLLLRCCHPEYDVSIIHGHDFILQIFLIKILIHPSTLFIRDRDFYRLTPFLEKSQLFLEKFSPFIKIYIQFAFYNDIKLSCIEYCVECH